MCPLSQTAEAAFACRGSAVAASQREIDDSYGRVAAVLNSQYQELRSGRGLKHGLAARTPSGIRLRRVFLGPAHRCEGSKACLRRAALG